MHNSLSFFSGAWATMKSLFLPAGLVLGFSIAWVWPELGQSVKSAGLMPWTIVVIFLLNGLQTRLNDLPRERVFFLALAVAALITLLLSPLLAALLAYWLPLSAGLILGLQVKAAMPSTLSTCIVMTRLAGGNPLWALVITVVLNMLAVFSIPFVLALSLGDGQLSLSPWQLLGQLMLLVLLPFSVGFLLSKLVAIRADHSLFQYLPSSCIILAVWMALSDSQQMFQTLSLSTFLNIALVTLLLHFGLMALAAISAWWLNVPESGWVAMLLTSSQKTLPVAITVLASLNQPVGEAVLMCVLFHFIQLFCDASVLPYLARLSKAAAQRSI